jgi:hypothetical protein
MQALTRVAIIVILDPADRVIRPSLSGAAAPLPQHTSYMHSKMMWLLGTHKPMEGPPYDASTHPRSDHHRSQSG